MGDTSISFDVIFLVKIFEIYKRNKTQPTLSSKLSCKTKRKLKTSKVAEIRKSVNFCKRRKENDHMLVKHEEKKKKKKKRKHTHT